MIDLLNIAKAALEAAVLIKNSKKILLQTNPEVATSNRPLDSGVLLFNILENIQIMIYSRIWFYSRYFLPTDFIKFTVFVILLCISVAKCSKT